MNTSKLLLLFCFVGASVAVSISLVPQNEAQVSSNATQTTMPTTTATNFSQAISQQVSSDPFLVDVAYESPKTVILQGSNSKFIEGGLGLVFNDFLWRGVDLLKNEGFTIDQIDLIRSGEAQEGYRIYMSHDE
jgi:shikimate 5-dehydrogenase